MSKWAKVIIVLLAIAAVVGTYKEEPPMHDPTADIVSIAHSYSGGGDLKLDGFHAVGVTKATIISYEDGWERIDYVKTNGTGGTALVYKG